MTVDTPVRVLLKGNEAIAEAAVQAGCDAYFGYPITPQAEPVRVDGATDARGRARVRPGRVGDRRDLDGPRRDRRT